MTTPSIEESQRWLNNQLNGAILFIILSVLTLSLRLVVVNLVDKQRKQTGFFSWENSLLLSSFVAFLPLCTAAIVMAQGYLASYHIRKPFEMANAYTRTYKASYVFSVAYPIACALPKISICCMYLNIFRINIYMRRAIQLTIGFLVLNAVAWLVPTIAVCHPISTYWKYEPHGNRCINYEVFGTWISLPNVVSDLAILCLPLPCLWSMNMSRARKVGLGITFMTGSIGIIGGCLRLAFYTKMTYKDQPGTKQPIKSIAVNVIVSYLEPGMYLIAACMPRLRALVSWMHSTISTSVSSLLARRRSSGGSAPPAEISPDGSPLGHTEIKCISNPMNVRLTGIGNLKSLAQAGDEIH